MSEPKPPPSPEVLEALRHVYRAMARDSERDSALLYPAAMRCWRVPSLTIIEAIEQAGASSEQFAKWDDELDAEEWDDELDAEERAERPAPVRDDVVTYEDLSPPDPDPLGTVLSTNAAYTKE
jgi:hypothetical protein